MRKRQLMVGLIMLLFGSAALFNSVGNPRYATLQSIDFVRLVACGACYGVGFVALIGKLKLGDD